MNAPDRPSWDPQQYLRHADHRTRPFHDLLAHIGDDLPGRPAPRIADLGCGAGNVTALLADRWPGARITGYDTSREMLAEAAAHARPPLLDFAEADAVTWEPAETYGLIVSTSALQWIPGHADHFPRWLDALAPGGTLAFQVPGNFTAPSHTLLAGLRESDRWRPLLHGVGDRSASVLDPVDYLTRLRDLGCTADVWETTYLQTLHGDDAVLDWVKGTALRPVLTALADDPAAREAFLAEYRDLLREAYPRGPYGTVFPFRRIFAVARKEK